MKQRPQGSFRKTKAGRWEYRLYYKDEFDVRRSKSFTADTQDECMKRAAAFMTRVQKHLKGVDVDQTIPDILRQKVTSDYEMGYTREQGYDRSLKTIDIIERHLLGQIPIIDVEIIHIDSFLRSVTRYSNNTISKIYTMLVSAFRIAVEQGVIDQSPMTNRALRCPRSKKKDKVVRGLTEEEQHRLLQTLEAYKVPKGRNCYKAQLLIELYSGLRMGEINALRPADIKLTKDGGSIHVERTVSRGIDCRPFINDSTKTDAGVRDVPISRPLIPILKDALAEARSNPLGLLFYDYVKGGIIETSQVNCFYRRVCEKAKIPFNGQHALRHTFATRCIESGIPAIVLKGWLGHTDIHITLDTYSDVFDRLNNNSVSLFNEYIKNIFDDTTEEDESDNVG